MLNGIKKFLQEAGIFYFCTADKAPHCRPFGAVAEIDGRLYFSTADTKSVYRELVANPLVQIVACKPSGEWIRVDGKAVVDGRESSRRAMLDACPVLLNHYKSPSDRGFAVFYLTDVSVERF
ncbi:MAG: pyridoxamine 5'-phosphate oxidase family protein [Clostridiales bacterium]|jgi:uncharacterized pyridoxamine 5'-phosphate oxidase family protein|nr:pyridoxamine 5'-phosphate oxidase family protein [Clostridiales bacterium]